MSLLLQPTNGTGLSLLVNTIRMGAISLNNTALSLLWRGFSTEALSTFKDALTQMRCAITLLTTTTRGGGGSYGDDPHVAAAEQGEHNNNVSVALARATKLSVLCKQETQHNTSPTLNVISTQSCPSNVIALASESYEVQRAAFPMTIDFIDRSCSADDLRFEAAVVLYNYGIACMIAMKDESLSMDDLMQSQLLGQAHRLFLMARAILGTMDNGNITCEPTGVSRRVLLLRTVMTYNLIQAAIQLNLGCTELNDYVQDMQCLLHFVKAQTLALPLPDHPVAPAA